MLVAVVYPVTREMIAHEPVGYTMINSLDVNDDAALKPWPGSIEFFIGVLHERCMSMHDGYSVACARYSRSGY